jgi:3-hydroxy-9,10-secoandrosta-1,3,5(10)-triene-9,17-dione monooxygenase
MPVEPKSAKNIPTTAQLLQRATELLPALRQRSTETDALGKVHPTTVADFQRAGFFKMFQSTCWGGYASHPADIFSVQEVLAQGCPSSAWIMGVVGVHNWQLAHFPRQAQTDVWGADPTVLLSSSYAPTGKVEAVDGGYVLSGRWSYSSGVDHAAWVLLGGIVPGDAALPDFRTFLVPRRDFRVLDDWQVMGLRGTGSKSVELERAFVPEHRQLPVIASQIGTTPGLAEGTAEGPLFLVPFPTIFGACITTPALGAAQRILDLFVEALPRSTSLYTGARWADEQVTQVRIAEADGLLRAARLQLAANFAEIMRDLEAKADVDLTKRARYRFDHCNLVDLAYQAADRIFVASGARSLRLDQPLQSLYRDILAARVHAINNRSKWATVLGRVTLEDYPTDLFGIFI